MSLVEYLYIDHRRLDSYFEQISSSPVAYDKAPVWEANITLTSPGAKGIQSRFARPFTTTEKVTQLVEYLTKNHFVAVHTPKDDTWVNDREFHLASFRATKVRIPSNPELPAFKGLVLWISSLIFSASHPKVNLFLLEDLQEDDRELKTGVWLLPEISGYSTLIRLLQAVVLGVSLIRARRQAREADRLRDTHQITSRQTNTLSSVFDALSATPYHDDPINVLSEFLGAEILTERPIRCLFRITEGGSDWGDMTSNSWIVAAYPIFVATANEDSLMTTAAQADSQ